MRSTPSSGRLMRVHRALGDYYTFCYRDVIKVMGASPATAYRYIERMRELGLIEYRFKDATLAHHYRVKRKEDDANRKTLSRVVRLP